MTEESDYIKPHKDNQVLIINNISFNKINPRNFVNIQVKIQEWTGNGKLSEDKKIFKK